MCVEKFAEEREEGKLERKAKKKAAETAKGSRGVSDTKRKRVSEKAAQVA